jgi:DNA-binding winged helix-turn-helix (wHTH) protein
MRRRFADCLLDSETRQLLRRGKPVHLPRKTYRLLELLVESAPRAVSKEEIRAALWPATSVSDASLTNAVARARAAIGDSAREPAFIRTLHGFGYAFAASLSEERVSGSTSGFSRYRLVLGNRRFTLLEGENILGRDPDAAVIVDHGSVSRHHARISIRGDKAILEDLQSRNGTFLRGQRIQAPAEVRDGDLIALGPVSLTFETLAVPGSTASDLSGG